MSEHPSWTCRPYQAGDEVHLAALFERVFERSMTPQLWTWKLHSHPGGVANVWLAVDAQDRPVCHYAGIPRRVRLADGERSVMVAVDNMTAPEFRRRGVFTEVVARAHAAWRDAGVAFVLGMPSETFGSRIDALGWQPVTSLSWMIRPLRPDLLLARRVGWARVPGLETAGRGWNALWDLGASSPAGLVSDTADRAESEAAFDALADAPGSSGRLALLRDSVWMAHRLLDPPTSPYEVAVAGAPHTPLGYAAYRVQEVNGRKIGAIAELVTRHEDRRVGSRLIREVVRRIGDEGAEMAIGLAVPGSPDHRLFRRRGFLFSWGTFDVRAVILDARVGIDAIRGAAGWTLAGGDFDLI